MFQIFLMSKIPITISISGTRFNISNTLVKKLEIDIGKTFEFDYFFTNSSSYIFHGKLNFVDDEFVCDDKNFHTIKMGDNSYILKFTTQNQCFLQKKCQKIKKNGYFFNFYQNGLVEIEDENNVLFCDETDFEILSAEVLELKNEFCAVKLFGKNNAERSVVFNQHFEPLFQFDTCILEATENGFKVLTNLKDIARHGLVEVFEIDEDVSKTNEYAVFMNEYAYNDFNIMVLPLYFMQCVRAGDYAEAKNCLTPKLQSRVKKEHLKQYFGEMLDRYVLENNFYVETTNSKGARIAKKFCFTLEDGKIGNIS
ncbi:MAG: hypothetical protein J6T39_02385 [Clostridia bacterium]|nr:hypothetical protein [Clostridia bacterium]